MTTDRLFEDYLEDMLEYAEKAHRFLEDTATLYAVMQALEVVGEAARYPIAVPAEKRKPNSKLLEYGTYLV